MDAAPRTPRRWSQLVLGLDRRIIYVIVFVLVLVPLLRPLQLPITLTPEVENAHRLVEGLKAGDAILISCDFGPSTAPECLPVLVSVLHQCFRKDVKPVIVTLTPDGRGMALRGIAIVRDGVGPDGQPLYPDLKYGEDYAFLGYKSGGTAVMIGVGQSFATTFPLDYNGAQTSSLPLMQHVRKLSDCAALFDIAAVGYPEYWVAYGSERYGVPMAVSCTAVSAAQYYPFVTSGQFVGLVNGMKGAAEYEQLVGIEEITGTIGSATRGMDAQTSVHIFIVLAIILANLALFNERRLAGGRL